MYKITDFKIDFSDNDLQIEIQKITNSKYHFPKNYYRIRIIEYSTNGIVIGEEDIFKFNAILDLAFKRNCDKIEGKC